jgi:2-polyprenyl-6-methoxyphenol hydroxylase-like FAD-dependent oxidoreductase
VRLDARCVRVTQDARGVVAGFADGREVHGDLLVGADGVHSVVRATLHGGQPPTYAGYTAWRAVVPFDTERLQAGESWGRGARFGRVGMSGGRVYWYATANAPEGQRNADEKAALLDLFRGWHAPIPALIEATAPGAILRNDIYDRPPLKTWGRGRITLLGDAAHPMTPNLGQGGCQAIEDAWVLARALARDPSPQGLRRYEAARHPRTRRFVLESWRFGKIAQTSNRLVIAVRNALVRMAPESRMQASLAWAFDFDLDA